MTPAEVDQILTALAQANGRPLGVIGDAALRQELPTMDFKATLNQLIELAKTVKWITAAHVLGNADKPPLGKYDRANDAWAEVVERSRGRGMLAVVSDKVSLSWYYPMTPQALHEIRQVIRYGTANDAKWAFREAYNRLTAEASQSQSELTESKTGGITPPNTPQGQLPPKKPSIQISEAWTPLAIQLINEQDDHAPKKPPRQPA